MPPPFKPSSWPPSMPRSPIASERAPTRRLRRKGLVVKRAHIRGGTNRAEGTLAPSRAVTGVAGSRSAQKEGDSCGGY
ncbi:hypothetical protein E1A91_D01G145200v1 [Gossypium mustelinum]|uniref:Uncharacterized protein n=1 Tax=Gossypium mustelinum TaxID=34275 RepID=A0A5D2W6M7_GOSMU|nr:hypothetical protein E1A91_D01G145200v1 [Gossypium mustelinum]